MGYACNPRAGDLHDDLSSSSLTFKSRNGEFKWRNTLSSKQSPKFTRSVPGSAVPRDAAKFPHRVQVNPYPVAGTVLSPDKPLSTLQLQYRTFDSTSWQDNCFTDSPPPALRDLGRSSPLFDGCSSADNSYIETPGPRKTISTSQISENPRKLRAKSHIESATPTTMVNERSPAKVPLNPTKTNELQPQTSQTSQTPPTKPPQPLDTPRFGQTSLPQSPFNHKALESRVFIKPKAQPVSRAVQKGEANDHSSMLCKRCLLLFVQELILRRYFTSGSHRPYKCCQRILHAITLNNKSKNP